MGFGSPYVHEDNMTKPHEETWTAKYGRCDPDDRGDIDIWHVNLPDASAVYLYDDEPRAKLIAHAPTMARLLLRLQWIEGEHCSTCPICAGAVEGYGHKEGCELAAVLRAAGVLP